MRVKSIHLMAILLLSTGSILAKDIPKSHVPSVILNNFKKEFPKVNDVEWERKGDHYNVEFEIGWFTDYEVTYNAAGEAIKHKQEIKKSDLPKVVLEAIEQQYTEYRIDDVEKITENGVEMYKIELEKWGEDFDVMYLKNGILIK
ncbi:PepSY-like domain-containing protein [Marinifilum sp. RC60d5]|uniref:PepSY-like domain-containing protein n=1 Tax=Marinifilum sp. RC60d5 TaxID=3458414 RepID=UPI004036106C